MIFLLHTLISAVQCFFSYHFACFGLLPHISVSFPFGSVWGFGTFSCLKYIFGTTLHGRQALGSQGPKRRGACGPAIVWLRHRSQLVGLFKCALDLRDQSVRKFASCKVWRLFWASKCTHRHGGIHNWLLLLYQEVICTRLRGCTSIFLFRGPSFPQLGYARHSAHQSSWYSSGVLSFTWRISNCASSIRHSS